MSRHRNFAGLATLLLCVAAVSLSGCGSGPAESAITSDPAQQLTLYSIDGDHFDLKKEQANSDDHFHGFPILGKVDIQDAAKKKEILDALKNGMSQSDGTVNKCYWPRHGIRTVSNGKTVDYVICFECLQLKIHRDGSEKTVPTTRRPQSVFNKHLKDADVPLAPGMAEDK